MGLDDRPIIFKVATEPSELEQVHRLNHETFAEEIPQHAPNGERRLVDAFHDENTYLIALRGERLVGMIALRARRPFSLDRKLPDLDRHLPAGCSPCEIRLLATTRDSRQGVVFRGLGRLLAQHALAQGHDVAVISGTLRQERLYRHLGFVPFGPPVGTAEAPYQPMMLTLDAFRAHGRAFAVAARTALASGASEPTSFLPGPVTLSRRVREALTAPSISHRAPEFAALLERVVGGLRTLTGASEVHLLSGSGTVANDAVAAEISTWRDADGAPSPGVILANGAFGERLIDHATRFGLRFETARAEWGSPLRFRDVESTLRDTGARWLWAVHGETSTGVLNDLPTLKDIVRSCGAMLAVDAVSSLGAAPVDLRGVALASSVSGKGLGAVAGIAIVFRDRSACAAGRRASPFPQSVPRPLPRSLDLDHHVEQRGIPATICSNLVRALDAALEETDDAWVAARGALGDRVRDGVRRLGLRVLATESAFPPVITLALPRTLDATAMGEWLEARGHRTHFRSAYLASRNWLQICTLGDLDGPAVEALLAVLPEAVLAHRVEVRRVTPPV